jgi:glutamine amidotransferase
MIVIVDYGAGNLVSVKKAFDHLRQDCLITSDPSEVAKAAKVVLPGVGHFASTASLARTGMKHAIQDAIQRAVPFLGICVGMQWMFESSAESPQTPGLALFPGNCERFPDHVKAPHVGWNSLQIDSGSGLFRGVASSSYVYFTHSFRAPVADFTTACCDYGGNFSAAIERDHIFGVQFHPEKSGETGLQLLSNFCAF